MTQVCFFYYKKYLLYVIAFVLCAVVQSNFATEFDDASGGDGDERYRSVCAEYERGQRERVRKNWQTILAQVSQGDHVITVIEEPDLGYGSSDSEEEPASAKKNQYGSYGNKTHHSEKEIVFSRGKRKKMIDCLVKIGQKGVREKFSRSRNKQCAFSY